MHASVGHACRVTPWSLRDRVRRLPAGELIVHVVVFVIGAALISLGLALVVLPGPLTIPPILLGLVVWSLEFEFAERWLAPWERRAQHAWAAAKLRPWRTGLVAGGGLVAAVALVLVLLSYDVLGALT
jgi:hypothetical protein